MVLALILFSGGLDSCLVVKILKEQNIKVHLLHFILPFGCGCFDLSSIEKFVKEEKVDFSVLDCTKGKLLKEYLKIIKNAKFPRGAGFNSCKDCKIFMLKNAKKFSKHIEADLIATGEVLGQRPLSQMKKDFDLIEGETNLRNKILRPLCAKLLNETIYEKKNLVDRKKFCEISGRNRRKQIELAKKYKIDFPNPAGGCLLCEKLLKNRFKFLIENNLINGKNFNLVNVGRHFLIADFWVILGRNKDENDILEKVKKGKLIVPNFPSPSVRVFDVKVSHHPTPQPPTPKNLSSKKTNLSQNPSSNPPPRNTASPALFLDKIQKLIQTYSKQGRLEDRKSWEKYKI